MSSARADFSGVAAAPLLVLDRADGLLDLPHPALEVLHPVARHLAGGVPAVGEVAEGLLGGVEVGDRDERLGLDEDLLLDLGVGGELLVERGVGGVAGTEERVLRAAEALPELVVDLARRRAGGLPLAHQVAVAAGGRAPLGRRRERLGLLGQALLDDAGAVAALVLLGEVRLAVPGVRRPRGGEAAPQRVVGGPVEAGQLLPRREQVAQPVGAVAPVGALGELLGLGDELLLLRLGLRALLGALLLAGRALDRDHGAERVEARRPGRRGRRRRGRRRPARAGT